MTSGRVRRLLLGGPVLLLLTVVVSITVSRSGIRSDGPYGASAGVEVEFAVPYGGVGTWAMGLPPNQTATDITLESVEPVGLRDLEVLGIVAHRPFGADGGSGVTAGSGYPFPPPGVTTYPIQGMVLPASDDPSTWIEVVIGVRRQNPDSGGTIDGLRVRYRVSNLEYEVTLPWSLRITVPPV